MNCKNSAQNAVKVAIFRLKIEKFSGEGANQTPPPLGRGTPPFQTLHPSILVPAALDLAPPRLQILDPPLVEPLNAPMR